MITTIDIVRPHVQRVVKVSVASKVPASRPKRFVRIDQGAPKRINPVVEQNIVFIQVYGDNLEWVLDTIGTIRDMLDEVELVDRRVQEWSESEGPHDYPDPDLSGVFRWQIAGTISYTE